MISLIKMNNKHKKTLKRLLTKPVLSNIKFDDVDKLLIALDLERIEASGSRITYKFDEDNFITCTNHIQTMKLNAMLLKNYKFYYLI